MSSKLLSSVIVLFAILFVHSFPLQAQSESEFRPSLKTWFEGSCRMGHCSKYYIVSAQQAGKSSIGMLFIINAVRRDESYGRRDYRSGPLSAIDSAPQAHFVFCSKTTPSVFYQNDGKWFVRYLKPGEPSAQFGFNETDYAFYYASCHNTTRAVNDALARRLGYHFKDGDLRDDTVLKSPFDVLN